MRSSQTNENIVLKIPQIISRERDISTNIQLPNDFFIGEPLELDFISNSVILERWSICFESNSYEDVIDIMLLLQSIYVKCKILPLGKHPQKTSLEVHYTTRSLPDYQILKFKPVLIGNGVVTVKLYYKSDYLPQEKHSPYPSPTLTKKSLYSKQKPPIPPRKSQLSISFSRASSKDSLSSDDSEPRENVQEKPKLTISTKRRDSLHAANGELFGSLVGSYEESILCGRMSALPSRPVPFKCDVGVVGFGKYRPKCPPHICIDFSAYFYELHDDHNPTSPYVGSVDLSNGYKIPAKGQLQIIIKNPSCTAIKVFLVPYDLSDMPPASKTFIRQKSYLSENRLKYAIHLNIQRDENGKIFLCSSMRIVFSPRQESEALKLVTQTPDSPKYCKDMKFPLKTWSDEGGR